MDDYLDIGHGVSIKFSEHKGLVVGIHERHPDKRDPNHLCCGFVFFNTPNNEAIRNGSPVWTVESIDPLTLSPSILCRTCGNHGFIQSGKWVPA
jgi:hypothetical protein